MANRTTSALLYLDAVSVSFDGFRALNNLSLTVEPGEMRAIIGPNGAGKTTMMDVITGKTRPDNGDVYFDGSFDLTTLDETQIAELGIGRKFQKPTVFDMHTVEDNLRLALKGDRTARKTLFWRETAPSRRASTRSSASSGSARCARASPAACRTDRSSGSRSACCWRRTRSCCWSTSRSPA
jgi:urea transport system ATP-binding protein